MIKGILFTVLSILIVGLVIYGCFALYMASENETSKKPGIIGLIASVVLLGVMITVPGSIHQVNTGEVAVVKRLGKVTGTKEPGIYFDFWMVNDYSYFDGKVRELPMTSNAYSKDNQVIGIELNLQYSIIASMADALYTQYGTHDKLDTKISAVALDNIKAVFAQYSATEIIANRSAISTEITKQVANSIDTAYFVKVQTIVLTNIDFTDDFEAAVASKVAAEQEALKAKNEQEKKKIEADTALYESQQRAAAAVAQAEADAKAILVKAQAQADAVILNANADSVATTLKSGAVAEMLGFDVTRTIDENGNTTCVIDFGDTSTMDANAIASRDARIKLLVTYLEYMKYLEIWDGKLPVTSVGDNGATVVIPAPSN